MPRTFSCSNGAIGDGAGGSLRQLFAKRVWIQGSFDITPPIGCTGETIAWTAPVVGSNGRFAAGKAHVHASISACDPVACTDASVDQDIQLRSARR